MALALTATVYFFWNSSAAWSTLFGSLLVVVPNSLLGLYLFTRTRHCNPRKTMAAFYVGEMLKIATMGFLLVLMLHYYNLGLEPLLLGLCGTYSVYLFAPMIIKTK